MPEEAVISYDRMKDQIEKEVLSSSGSSANREELLPQISFEKGTTRISFVAQPITPAMMLEFITLIKQHLDNVRVHAFDSGYYAFQAMNKNLFKSENILDNIKLEFFVLSGSSRVEISKKGNLTQEEINLTVEIHRRASAASKRDPASRLRLLGAALIEADPKLTWDYLAGYDEVKRKIRETIILPLTNPAIYDAVAKMTRRVFESNRPRAVLFDGAPGVGKTTAARIIAGEAEVPLVYVPVESIMSKWYGQSSQNLSAVFDACEDLGGSIIFIDEIDSLAGTRDANMFEATRRVLSVLLRRLDGIGAVERTLTIGATNRKDDLDRALLSRFDQTIYFPLPNASERAAIFANYAKHLSAEECASLAEIEDGLSGRNIKDICEFTERRWVRKLLIKNRGPSLPPFEMYRQAMRIWKENR